MPRHQYASEESTGLRRAKPAYVLSLTVTTIAFWWLVAVSQTPLSGGSDDGADAASVEIPAAPPPIDDNPARIAAASQELQRTQLAVNASRENVAASQQRWEEWLALRAKRERERARQRQPTLPEPTLGALVANPQYTELAATLQRLTVERDALLQRLTPEHPSVREANSRMDSVAQKMDSVPELIRGPAPSPAPAATTTDNSHGPSLSGDSAAAEAELADAAASGGNEQEVRQEWDAAQENLRTSLDAEQLALDRYEQIRQQIAAAPVAAPAVRAPEIASSGSHSAKAGGGWSLLLALAVLCGAELAGVRLAMTLLAAEKSVPLQSVAQVTSLLPVPVLAVFPSVGPRPARPGPGSVSSLTLWLLACEGTMAVLVFMVTALTIRNLGFPAELFKHPVDTMAQALREFHS